jgi:hypothetical protein
VHHREYRHYKSAGNTALNAGGIRVNLERQARAMTLLADPQMHHRNAHRRWFLGRLFHHNPCTMLARQHLAKPSNEASCRKHDADCGY